MMPPEGTGSRSHKRADRHRSKNSDRYPASGRRGHLDFGKVSITVAPKPKEKLDFDREPLPFDALRSSKSSSRSGGSSCSGTSRASRASSCIYGINTEKASKNKI